MVGVKRRGAMLAEVADLGIATVGDFAFLEFDFVGEDFEKGGFASAVGADEGDAFATFDLEVEAAIDDMVAVGHVDAFEQDGALAAAFGLRDAETERFFRGLGALDFFHALDLLELALGLGGFGGDGAEAVGEFLERGDFLLLVFVGGGLDFVIALALVHRGGVVAGVVDEFFGGDFVNAVDEGVHEFEIVGDEQEGTGAGFEILLEPEEGEEVEVVGRFVEEEEVGLHDEEAGEVGAHDPAAAEFLGGAGPVGLAVA